MSDELLVVRCQLGERDAFPELVRTWHDPVSRFVQRMLGPGNSDDVTQEVWVAVLRGLPRLRHPDRFAPWLFTLARRAVINQLRAEYARPESVGDFDGTAPDELAAVVDRAAVAVGLAELPPRDREVLILFHLEDLSLEACAEICDVPLGTIKSRLFRARRLLHAALTAKGYPS